MNQANHQTSVQTHPLPRRPSPPPSFRRSDGPLTIPKDGFVLYQPEDRPQPSTEATSVIVKHATPTASPDGAPSPAGRRRARTKVVAWDPRDLEDIYYRKEVAKEDWDTICKVYPTRTKVAMRQQKLREKKQREADGLPPKSRKSSTLADPSQSAPHNSQWASVNGGHASEHSEGEESGDNDEYEMSDAPDSDVELRHHNNDKTEPLFKPSLITPLETIPQTTTDTVPQQSATTPMPFEVQQIQHFNNQSPANFDVVAAQSKGKAIAPRQPPSSAVPTNPFQEGQPGPQGNRPTQRGRGKRAREKDGAAQDPTIDPETGLLTIMSKRRRQEREPAATETAMMPGGSSENYATPSHPAVARPVPPPTMMPPPPRMPPEADVEQVCAQVREIYRAARAASAAELRTTQETFWESLERAHARTSEAEVRYDEVEMRSAEQIKENNYNSQAEVKKVISQLNSERAEKERLRSELEQSRREIDQHRQELDQHRQDCDEHRRELMGARTNLEQLRHEKARVNSGAPTAQMLPTSDASKQEGLNQQLRAAQEKAERADTANNLLNEKVSEMRLGSKELCEKLVEIQKQHNEVTSSLDDLHSKDLEDLTNKLIRKHVNAVKEADLKLTGLLRNAKESLDKPSHLMFESPVHPTTNGSSAAHIS
ncbi:MAG: hypothetical protein Q9174_001693 [Haloplaca sp. 1 TL-2023]